jgi:PAS domain S-box-containing protein
MDTLKGEGISGIFSVLSNHHSHVIPAESFGDLTNQPDRMREIAALQQRAASLETEVDERRRAEVTAERLAAIVESSDDAIIGKTPEGIITSWNQGAQRIYGYTAAEVVGRPISLLIPEDRPDELPGIMRRLNRGERIDHFETERMTRDGRRITVSVTISPIRDTDGTVIGASAVAREITDQKRLEREQEELLARESAARAEAEAALRLRDEFLSIASHELRTPLSSLKGYTQLALRRIERTGEVDKEHAVETLQAIARQTDRLDGLLGHLLDMSRLDAGKLVLDRQLLNLSTLVAQAVDAARARGSTHPITLKAPETLQIQVDPLRLEQVFGNLLDNAIRYSPEKGPIEVEVTPTDGGAWISVRDHGLGISPEQRPRIFERYYQAHGGGFRSGLGLGLHISKQILELHGGNISVEFPPDGGSRFVVDLPLT